MLANFGIRTRGLPLTTRRRYHWDTRAKLNVCRRDKSSPCVDCAIFRNLPVACGRCRKMICRVVFVIYHLYRFDVWTIKKFADCKELTKYNSSNLFDARISNRDLVFFAQFILHESHRWVHFYFMYFIHFIALFMTYKFIAKLLNLLYSSFSNKPTYLPLSNQAAFQI